MSQPAKKIVIPHHLEFLMRSDPVQGRECGECTACCTALGVTELQKPQYTTCQHLCDKGCAIYEQRPHACRTWSCLWLLGYIAGDERRRPDRLGLIFTSVDRPDGTQLLVAWELWKDAATKLPGSYLINRVGDRYPMFIKRYGTAEPVLVGPKAVVAQIQLAGPVTRWEM